jgi:uncharacterized delta-60 repeat protein
MVAACAFAIAAGVAIALASAPAQGATSSTVVGATVPSATSIDAAGCATGVAGKTDFGAITAGSTNLTTIDCDVAFGSSNDTAQLRMRQSDGLGGGMWMPTRGTLDVDFDGPSGTANGAFLEPLMGISDDAYALAVQPDGKIVAAGSCDSGLDMDFCLARYNADGSRDVDFDGPSGTANGEFIEPIGASDDNLRSIAVQPDGKIIAAGRCFNGVDSDFCLARYNANGSRDVDFDGPSGTANGEFIEPIGAGHDRATATAVQPDGKIIVVGSCEGGTDDDFCLARYNANGSRDVDFDGPSGTANGEFIEPIGAGYDGATATAVQPDGKIIAAGYCLTGGNNDFCLARYNANGSRDVDFDGPSGTANGEFLEPIGAADDYLFTMVLQPDGRIIAAGTCDNGGNNDFCLARYNANGSRDVDFDGPSGTANGEFIEPIGALYDGARSLAAQPDGKIIAAGSCGNGTDNDLCLARYNADGTRDAGFVGPSGTANGEFLVPIGAGGDFPAAMSLQADGRISVAGGCENGPTYEFCLASFDQGGAFDDYVTGGGSDRDFASGASTSFFAACLRATSGGAFATWVASNPCPAADGGFWNDVPAVSEQIAYTTALEPDPPDATAHLRFALRAASDQPAGDYIAPITFDVLAPG